MYAHSLNLQSHGPRYSWKPDFIADTVTDINFDYLQQQGITAALIDLDSTIVARGTFEVSADVATHLSSQPLLLFIATNRPRSRSLKNLKEVVNADGVIHPRGFIGKPFAQYYAQAARDYGLKPAEVVMIGDRFIQDIFGANAAGLTTIAVRKLDSPINWFDTYLSRLEGQFIDRLMPSYIKIT